MACTISKGKKRYCKVQPGGLQNLYVSSMYTANVITKVVPDATTGIVPHTGITNAGDLDMYGFELDPYLSALTQTIIVDAGGGIGYQQDLEVVLKGVYGKADLLVDALTRGAWQMLVEDNSGSFYFCGLKAGMICTGGSFIHNGDKALADGIAYTLTFSAQEKDYASNFGDETNIALLETNTKISRTFAGALDGS